MNELPLRKVNMNTDGFDDELERRLRLLVDNDSQESVLGDLPVSDVVYAVIGIVVLTVLMLLWGYGR